MAQVTVLQIESAIEKAIKLENSYQMNAGYRRVARQAFQKAAFAWEALYELVDNATVATLRAVDAKYQQHVSEAVSRCWNKEG